MQPEVNEQGRARLGAVAFAVAALSVVPFLVARHGPFLFDDNFLVSGDPRVRDLALWRRWFTEDFWNVPYATAQLAERLHYWRPLVTASFAFDHARGAAGGSATFHDTNFALHALVSLLTFALLRRLAFAPLAAAAGALVAAWHPARVESVAWIVGRTDILCAIGVLAVLVADGLRSRAAALGLGAIGVLVAFASKETAVSLPAVLLGARLVEDSRRGANLDDPRAILRRHGPSVLGFALVSVAYLGARRAWMPMTSLHRDGVRLDRVVAVVLESLGRYVELTFAPYDVAILRAGIRRDAHGVIPSWPFVALGLASIVVFVLVLAWSRSRPRPLTATAGLALLFLGPLAPCLNLVPTGMTTLVAPRFLYIPLIAFAVAFAWLAERAIASARSWIGVAFAAAFGVASLGRASDFRTLDSFWDAEARSAPDNLAVHLARIARSMEEHKHRAALAEAKQSVIDSIAHGESSALRDASFEAMLRAASKLLPDAAASEIATLQRCVRALERGEPAGRLELPSLALVVDFGKVGPRPLSTVRPRLGTIATELALRVGDEADARAHLDAVLARPTAYLEVLGPFVSFAAKLGDADAVESLAERAVEPMRSEWRVLATVVREDERIAAAGGLARVSVLARRALHGRALAAFEALAPEVRATAELDYPALLVRAGYTKRGRAALEALAASRGGIGVPIDELVARWSSETDWGREE